MEFLVFLTKTPVRFPGFLILYGAALVWGLILYGVLICIWFLD